jgi:hypothetical protein
MKQKEALLTLGILAIFVISISFASAGWFSDLFKTNKTSLTGDASGGSNTIQGASTSKTVCSGTNTLDCSKGVNRRFFGVKSLIPCKTVYPYNTYCKVAGNTCVKKACSEVTSSACGKNKYGCAQTTSSSSPSSSSPTYVKVTASVPGTSTTVTANIPDTFYKLQGDHKYVWCWKNTQVGSVGYICIDKCGTVNYATGTMYGCQSAVLLK